MRRKAVSASKWVDMEKTMKREMGERRRLLTGAATIAAGGLVAKLIGALYRIPLTNLIGSEGIGLYQLVYPFYCLLLTVSATGIPSAIATLTARKCAAGESALPLYKTCMRLFLWIGGVSALLMCLLAPWLSGLQGESRLTGGYLALAPSVVMVSAISVLRGYFQGRNEMLPTALSEIIEQVVKVAVGLAAAYYFRADVYRAVVALLGAVSVSEGVALLFLYFRFRRSPAHDKSLKAGQKTTVREVLKLSLPLTFSSGLIPLFSLIDSILIVRLLGEYLPNSVALYGLFAGGATTVINLPVSVCYGIAAASVPALSSAIKRGENGRKKLLYSLGLTAGLSALSAVGLYLFARPAVRILFSSLAAEETEVLVGLIKAFSVSAITLSCTQTLSACLTALGKPILSAVSMLLAMLIKTAVSVWLLRMPSVGIYGAVAAASVGYATSFLLDLFFALRATR